MTKRPEAMRVGQMGENQGMSKSVQIARDVLAESIDNNEFGKHLKSIDEGNGLLSEFFECTVVGYFGWHWTVSLSMFDGHVTVNDVVLLPGEDAVLAPAWTPYRERVQPEDLGPGDVLPPDADDIRLVPAWSAGDGDGTGVVDRHFAREIGLGREWVLSFEGREDAADRWYDGSHGPESAFAKQAAGSCKSCGFLVSLAGDLSDRFGVCANRTSPADGSVVALNFGCGAHSGTRPTRSNSAKIVPDSVFDTISVDEFSAH